ncbi:alpha/beta fold hydrolase [Lentzea sp. E54]|uniref:alpha/beta fold hydrolase n=1 Tax=Lentzea xerophila TaxID=3435883 RepID=UPI003DA50C4E
MNYGSALSSDGTMVRYQMWGRGAPFVVVPGTLTPSNAYRGLVRQLAERHAVVVLERRGYGVTESGPSPFHFSQQVDDLLAVLNSLPTPAALFGHSFGGLISLAAALADQHAVSELHLYEPPVALLGDALTPLLNRCRRAIDDGRPDAAIRAALSVSGSPSTSPADVSVEVVERLALLLPGLILDLECVVAMRMPISYWEGFSRPLTLLRGELTVGDYRRGIDLLRALYPKARCEILCGQAHLPSDMSLLVPLLTSRT